MWTTRRWCGVPSLLTLTWQRFSLPAVAQPCPAKVGGGALRVYKPAAYHQRVLVCCCVFAERDWAEFFDNAQYVPPSAEQTQSMHGPTP